MAEPALVEAVRAGDVCPLEAFDLTERERRRLVEVSGHPGMAVNCTLVRSNRLIPIALGLPSVCELLGSRLREVLDQYWAEGERSVHYRREIDGFVAHLRAELEAGKLDVPGLSDALTSDSGVVCNTGATDSR